MKNQIINAENLNVIGIFAVGLTTGVIIPIIKTFFSEWRKNAPYRKKLRNEKRLIHIERMKALKNKNKED